MSCEPTELKESFSCYKNFQVYLAPLNEYIEPEISEEVLSKILSVYDSLCNDLIQDQPL